MGSGDGTRTGDVGITMMVAPGAGEGSDDGTCGL